MKFRCSGQLIIESKKDFICEAEDEEEAWDKFYSYLEDHSYWAELEADIEEMKDE